MARKMVPDGFRGWAIFSADGRRISELFQSPEIAKRYASDDEQIRYGSVEGDSFIDPALERQR
jgi:hypothetical protein